MAARPEEISAGRFELVMRRVDSPVVKAHIGEPAEPRTSDVAVTAVVKMEEEKRFTLGVAYPAMRPDVGKAADGYRDFASAEELEATAWRWMTKSRDIGLFHAGEGGKGEVVESYIWRADPWVLKAVDGSERTIYPGDWVLGVQWSDPAWALIKAKRVNGLSPQGGARRHVPSPDRLAELRS